jgi:putative ABC transport system substrate-binding protein
LTLTLEVSPTTSRALTLIGKLSLKLADTLTFLFKVSAVSGERDGPEPQDRQGARPQRAAIDLASRRRGDRMKMRRREFIAGLGGTVALPLVEARAQQAKVPVVGFLGPAGDSRRFLAEAGFFQALNESGYYEGRNVVFELRLAENQHERLPGLARDLVQRRVDVIVAGGPAAPAAKAATSTIPIVFGVGSDPVELGLVSNLARPGGNVTGVTILNRELMAKRLEILHELVPNEKVVGLLVPPSGSCDSAW